MPSARYVLSVRAEQDLLQIALYGIENFGPETSLRYRDMLKTRFEQIAETPERYPLVEYIRPGYRRTVCGVHTIYYRVTDGVPEIVRILGRQDPGLAF